MKNGCKWHRIVLIISVTLTVSTGCALLGRSEPKQVSAESRPLVTPATEPRHDRGGTGVKPDYTDGGTGAPERMLEAGDLEGLTWRSIGPANMGGRVAAIALAPQNPRTFFVGFATGGLFKTTNGGTTFSPVFDKEATSSIGSVAVVDAPLDWAGWKDEAPADAEKPATTPLADKGKAKIIWVGTGEGNGRNSSSWGNGVYRSTDGGSTFTHLGLTDSHDIPSLGVDPRDPDICYVAALGHLWGPNEQRGVYKTTDGGKTWQAVLQIDEDTGACDVIIDPHQPDTVFAAMYMRRRAAYSFQSGGPEGGIYRSSDAGATWTKLTNGLPAQTGRIGLDIYAKDPRMVYAVIESDEGGAGVSPWDNRSRAGGVFRSEDSGDTWERMTHLNPRPFYFSRIRIDPTDDQRIYLLGWNLYVSDDGGRSFRAGGARKPHVDMQALVIDPDDRDHLLIGTDGGIYISNDRGQAWDFLNHLAVGQFYNIALDMSDPYRIGGGLQDNGTWMGPSGTLRRSVAGDMGTADGGITNSDWSFVYNGDGFHFAFDPLDPNIVYAELQGGSIGRVHLDTGRRKKINPSPKEGQPRFRFNWNAPFLVSVHEPTTLYFGGNCVFKLTERGDRWHRISEDLSGQEIDKIMAAGSTAENYGTITSLAESSLATGMLWAGTDDGHIHVTTNDGKSWKEVTPVEVGGLYISKIETSRHDRDTCYVSIDGHRSNDYGPHLIMTIDAGRTWQSIVGDLPPGRSIRVVREDRTNPSVLYVGTESALYVSIDRGRHWVKLNGDSLPTVPVHDIAQHPRELDLVAGTHGRSIYVLDDASCLGQLTPEVIQSDLRVFDVRPAKPRLYLPYGGLWSDRMFVAKNPPMGARITYWIREYTGEDVKIAITDANDTKIREITGTNKPGLNRVVWDLQMEKYDRIRDPDSSGLGQTRFVPAGVYNVKVTSGKQSVTTTVNVLTEP
ncbi:MAG: hypothetical protein JSU63_18305 [Phycisphaerales bacterium]|nr:MAG: hypothetical protein JSU63_18305 [Phycisphaerales bacterium]